MRLDALVHKSRAGRSSWRASKLALPASAVAVGAAPIALLAVPAIADTAAGHSDPQDNLEAQISPLRVGYPNKVIVSGSASTSQAGQRVELDYLPAGKASWRAVGSTTIGPRGRFRISTLLRHSGTVKVTTSPSVGSSGSSVSYRSDPNPAGASSASHHVSVVAKLRVPRRTIGALPGQRVDVRGKLLPGVAGRTVSLQARGDAAGWHTVASARTRVSGGFRLRYSPHGAVQQKLRVRFAGDQLNAWANADAGNVSTYRQSLASWYDDSGATACGFHAYYGVANKSLPCGTKVAFRYGGHSVVAVVDDRGPYAGGREWDLNQNTAAALGFGGVGSVWSSA